jgi:hypothetical protein
MLTLLRIIRTSTGTVTVGKGRQLPKLMLCMYNILLTLSSPPPCMNTKFA